VIVVVGSRHDPIAADLVAWGAALCSADDLVRAGWTWGDDTRRWVIGGERVDDRDVSGVLVRRSCVYPEELVTIHPEDRAYVAAETDAFLGYVLGTTRSIVCNPVVDGAYGQAALRFERWIAEATAAGVECYPHRFTAASESPPAAPIEIEVVGGEVCTDGNDRDREAAAGLARRLGLHWAMCRFDRRHRLVGISITPAPSTAARDRLARMLA
jgi:hypothetical protein